MENSHVAGLYLRNASGNNCIPAHLAGIHVTAHLTSPHVTPGTPAGSLRHCSIPTVLAFVTEGAAIFSFHSLAHVRH